MELFLSSLLGLFLIGGVFATIVLALIENDKPTFATVFVAASAAVYFWLYSINPFAWIVANIGSFLVYLFFYFVFGSLTAGIKYILFARSYTKKYEEQKEDYLSNHSEEEFVEKGVAYRIVDRLGPQPKVRDYKGHLMVWASYWPLVGLWTLINEPVKHTFIWIYDNCGKILQRISDRMFRDINADLAKSKTR